MMEEATCAYVYLLEESWLCWWCEVWPWDMCIPNHSLLSPPTFSVAIMCFLLAASVSLCYPMHIQMPIFKRNSFSA